MNGYAMIQTIPSIAIMASVAQRVPFVVICLVVLLAPSVALQDVVPLVIHGIALKIIGVMISMMMQVLNAVVSFSSASKKLIRMLSIYNETLKSTQHQNIVSPYRGSPTPLFVCIAKNKIE